MLLCKGAKSPYRLQTVDYRLQTTDCRDYRLKTTNYRPWTAEPTDNTLCRSPNFSLDPPSVLYEQRRTEPKSATLGNIL